MASSSLVVHRGARIVERKELDSVLAPPPTQTWYPLAHSSVLDGVTSTLKGAGFNPQKITLALSADNARFFGTIDLESAIVSGVSLAVGVRNSIDKSLPIGMVAGNRVFVCDNLAMRSEILVVRKHTRFGEIRFGEAVAKAVGSLGAFQESERFRIRHFQNKELTDTQAESLILRMYEREIISHHFLPRVLAEWRRPSFEEFEPRTYWSLENAATTPLADVFKSNPQRFCGITMALQGLLSEAAGLGSPPNQQAEVAEVTAA